MGIAPEDAVNARTGLENPTLYSVRERRFNE